MAKQAGGADHLWDEMTLYSIEGLPLLVRSPHLQYSNNPLSKVVSLCKVSGVSVGGLRGESEGGGRNPFRAKHLFHTSPGKVSDEAVREHSIPLV